jgi:hypothetical protein
VHILVIIIGVKIIYTRHNILSTHRLLVGHRKKIYIFLLCYKRLPFVFLSKTFTFILLQDKYLKEEEYRQLSG